MCHECPVSGLEANLHSLRSCVRQMVTILLLSDPAMCTPHHQVAPADLCPGNRRNCFGLNICCGEELGCYVSTVETLHCLGSACPCSCLTPSFTSGTHKSPPCSAVTTHYSWLCYLCNMNSRPRGVLKTKDKSW
uniref:Uncharacterized protein n=1 Tax=Crocodylus porosus TaxID=8502 RepID=A0A7M4ENJ6_CROPO